MRSSKYKSLIENALQPLLRSTPSIFSALLRSDRRRRNRIGHELRTRQRKGALLPGDSRYRDVLPVAALLCVIIGAVYWQR